MLFWKRGGLGGIGNSYKMKEGIDFRYNYFGSKNKKVKCFICNKEFLSLSGHLKIHNLKWKDYLKNLKPKERQTYKYIYTKAERQFNLGMYYYGKARELAFSNRGFEMEMDIEKDDEDMIKEYRVVGEIPKEAFKFGKKAAKHFDNSFKMTNDKSLKFSSLWFTGRTLHALAMFEEAINYYKEAMKYDPNIHKNNAMYKAYITAAIKREW